MTYTPLTPEALAADLREGEAHARRVTLATSERSPLGPAVSAQRYTDRVVDAGIAAAPLALKDVLAAVTVAIEGASSYAEVEQRLVDLAGREIMQAPDFEALVEGAVLLGLGAGAWAVGEEAG